MEIGDVVEVSASTHNYTFIGVVEKVYGSSGIGLATVISAPGVIPKIGGTAYITSEDIVMGVF